MHFYLYVLHVKVPGVAEGIQRTIVLICWEVSGARFNRERLGRTTDTYLFDFTIRTLFLDHGIFRVFPQAQVLQPPLLEQHRLRVRKRLIGHNHAFPQFDISPGVVLVKKRLFKKGFNLFSDFQSDSLRFLAVGLARIK